ncbi:peptide-methionine (S)-S-oxide reductase [Candidatus Roizmanbacteria bacterium RIFCSPHIGHO2_02_FULL_39_9]|uniref:Peptide methionine sulfoxide reductase MsrA n=1 Tax=Candidatus Roizmanbacteria bacterium RIFCSPHIGHO2_02_FULL_39_9 TaxID=1802040 RepID=A0A1F7HBE2_9BACT|nr:MAG: peptide-methionine (S)-S-oxide reductase [Candidatus Roizmanbacteria bacterium RIFCSPHIGHO2_02_FULL_39_9]
MKKTALATFGGGCFWFTETLFKELKGVEKVVSGYAGGKTANPNYYELHENNTGHAECIQITFDPSIISYETLLEIFFLTHNPTTLNKQGYDVGTEYRSVIFYHNEEQEKSAEKIKKKIDDEKIYDNPIVTEIVPYTAFYPAEEFHQDFYKRNQDSPYCEVIINPKLSKFRERFSQLLKKE